MAGEPLIVRVLRTGEAETTSVTVIEDTTKDVEAETTSVIVIEDTTKDVEAGSCSVVVLIDTFAGGCAVHGTDETTTEVDVTTDKIVLAEP